MKIHIESLQIDAIIGLLDFERLKEQRVIVDLELEYHYSKKSFINYADIAKLIELQIIESQYELLEDALLELKENITAKYPKIQTLFLKISKPDILDNSSVALSHIWIFNKSNQ